MPLWPGAPYEYAAVACDFVFAAGACPIDDDGLVVSPGDLEAQSALCVENLRAVVSTSD
jgi:enamine deaminase RidA (YjgF/YER057c/UK114 family)